MIKQTQTSQWSLPVLLAGVLVALAWDVQLLRSGLTVTAGVLVLDLLLAAVAAFTLSKVLREVLPLRRWGCSLAYLAAFVLVTLAFLAQFGTPVELWDSWQVYDFSRFVAEDFGYGRQLRQYIVNTPYEMAFPPLMLWLVYGVNALAGLKVLATSYLTYLFALLTLAELTRPLVRMQHNRGFAALAVLLALCSGEYLHNMMAGNSIVIGMYLMVRLYNIAFGDAPLRRKYALSAVTAALALMLRFDFLSVLVLVLAGFPLIDWFREKQRTTGQKLADILLITALALVLISPWVVYSLEHFDTLFVTDNMRRLVNIPDTRPNTYFPADAPALTLFDDFGAWFAAFWVRVCTALGGLWTILSRNSVLLVGAGLALWMLVRRARGYVLVRPTRWADLPYERFLLALAVLSQEALVVLTGYPNPRYHMTFVLLLAFMLLELLDLEGFLRRACGAALVCLVCCGLQLWGLALGTGEVWHGLAQGEGFAPRIQLTEQEQAMDDYLTARDARLLMDLKTYEPVDRAKYSALCGHTTAFTPTNLGQDNAASFVRAFELDYLYTRREELLALYAADFTLEETPLPDLYRLAPLPD